MEIYSEKKNLWDINIETRPIITDSPPIGQGPPKSRKISNSPPKKIWAKISRSPHNLGGGQKPCQLTKAEIN